MHSFPPESDPCLCLSSAVRIDLQSGPDKVRLEVRAQVVRRLERPDG